MDAVENAEVAEIKRVVLIRDLGSLNHLHHSFTCMFEIGSGRREMNSWDDVGGRIRIFSPFGQGCSLV